MEAMTVELSPAASTPAIGYSLHRARTPKVCGRCGGEIPASTREVAVAYWRVHVPRSATGPRVLCRDCHAGQGLPTNGWSEPPDGRAVVACVLPARPDLPY